jgi:phosphoserine phosphatase
VAVRLVAFDLDGTLIRERNSLTVLGAAFDRPEWADRMEILYMRGESPEQMRCRVAPWLAIPLAERCHPLATARLAPGVDEAFRLLHERGVTTAIVSISWDFIVEWFARRFGAAHWAAVGLGADGAVTPFWPEDKGPWLERQMAMLGVTRDEVAAVGDSPRDASLLRASGHAFYVGPELPPDLHGIHHHPDGDLGVVARAILRC